MARKENMLSLLLMVELEETQAGQFKYNVQARGMKSDDVEYSESEDKAAQRLANIFLEGAVREFGKPSKFTEVHVDKRKRDRVINEEHLTEIGRERVPEPRTFQHFPEEKECPVCHKNDDGTCVLLVIDGTEEGGIAEAEPVHLACALADRITRASGRAIIYRTLEEK